MRRSRGLHLRTYGLAFFCLITSLAVLAEWAEAADSAAGRARGFNESKASCEAYCIAVGDVVSVTVWGYRQFSQECQVNAAGTISYPLLGDVRASGLTCVELQTELEKGLKKYLKRPQVLVRVAHYGEAGTSVFVIGEVNAPGAYAVSGDMGLVHALAAAGGATSRAGGEITIVEAGTGNISTVGMEEVLAEQQSAGRVTIRPGDVIVVNGKANADRPRRYTVLGEVSNPGIYDIPADGEATVLDAMEKAGLLAGGSGGRAGSSAASADVRFPTADLEHAFLTRRDMVVPLDLAALLEGDTSQNLLLQEGDVLTVPRRSLISVYALGEVRSQGRQDVPSQSTVMHLLNAAEGVTASADLGQAALLRVVDGQPTSIQVDLGALLRHADSEQNVALEQGDVLFVPSQGERKNDLVHFLPIIAYLLN